MACNLKEQSLKQLNTYSQLQINRAVEGKLNLDEQGIDTATKKLYDLLINQKKFSSEYIEQFIQAFPGQVFYIITNDQDNGYLSKLFAVDNPVNLNYLGELNKRFEDLDEVKSFVTTKKKQSKKSIKKEIKKQNKSRENINQDNVPTNLVSSVMTNNKPRPAYPNTTTGQMAHAENPDTVAEELKNVKDPEKKMF